MGGSRPGGAHRGRDLHARSLCCSCRLLLPHIVFFSLPPCRRRCRRSISCTASIWAGQAQEGSGLCSCVHRHGVRPHGLWEEPQHVRLRQAAREPGIVCQALLDILEGGVGRGGGGGGVSSAGGEGDGHGEDDAGFGMGLFVQVAVLEIYNEEIYDLLVGSGSNAKGNTPKASIGIFGTGGYLGSYGGVGGYGNTPPGIQIRSLQKIAMILQVAF